MFDPQRFDEEEKALFADDDTTTPSQEKGLRFVPSPWMVEFLDWLNRRHPEIPEIRAIDLQTMSHLLFEFENEMGITSGYTPKEWLRSLRIL